MRRSLPTERTLASRLADRRAAPSLARPLVRGQSNEPAWRRWRAPRVRWRRGRSRDVRPGLPFPTSSAYQIVVVGGGFAGVRAVVGVVGRLWFWERRPREGSPCRYRPPVFVTGSRAMRSPATDVDRTRPAPGGVRRRLDHGGHPAHGNSPASRPWFRPAFRPSVQIRPCSESQTRNARVALRPPSRWA